MKKMEKNFRALIGFVKFYKNRKVKIKFISDTTNKKICTVKFTRQEFNIILLASKLANQSIQEFFIATIKDIAGNYPSQSPH